MDKLEQYYRKHAGEMDQLEPQPESWDAIRGQLDPSPRMHTRWGWWVAAALVLLATSFWTFGIQQEDSAQEYSQTEIFPDIRLRSPEGNTVSLSSLDDKVVLVKFWASWCNVCREHNCDVLLPLYDEYKAKGFEVYAVSLDENLHQWKYGIERDQLPWVQVSDLQGFASPVSQRMGVSTTNTTFLLDRNRKIIGKNLSREELEYKIQQSCEDPL